MLNTILKSLFLIFIIGALSPNADAQCRTNANVNACLNVEITQLAVVEGGGLFVVTDGNEGNLECVAFLNNILLLSSDTEGFSEFYAILLSAFHARQPLTLHVQEVSDSSLCIIKWIQMVR